MKTKELKKVTVKAKLNSALETAKKSATKANDYALNTTEEVVLETITIASQWQKVTEKAFKESVKLMANQQELIFDTLETFKANLLDGKKKIGKIFA